MPDEPNAWLRLARCAGAGAPPPEFFYPEDGVGADKAKRYCRSGDGCPVLMDCLRYAIEQNETYGVWGGHGQRERVRVRKIFEQSGRLIDVVELDRRERQAMLASRRSAREEL